MIPRIIHQTWKTEMVPPQFRAFQQSWIEKNPGWTYMFWSDRALMNFVDEHYPEQLEAYCSYREGVRRSDAARYMLLDHFGGVYADLDTECLETFEPFVSENRLILAEEPPKHWPPQLRNRFTIDRLLFNGVMVSPAKHPLWRRLLDELPNMFGSFHTLDATGPCLLSAVVGTHPKPEEIAIYPSILFTDIDHEGNPPDGGADGHFTTYARHHWAGTWYRSRGDNRLVSKALKYFFKTRYLLTRGPQLDPAAEVARFDPAIRQAPPPSGDQLAILVPVRDAVDHIAPFLEAVGELDVPSEKIKLVFCEGDSTDGSFERLRELTEPLRGRYRDIRVLKFEVGNKISREKRWKRKLQRTRRSGLAKVRNVLIDQGLDETDDWALWIDIDVWKFPANIVSLLRESGGRVVVPNTRREPGGLSYDMNSFVQQEMPQDYRYWRAMKHGLYQPKNVHWGRLSLNDMRYLDKVYLDAVGGTMLLVDAALHRAGLRFPEIPYRGMVETEGLGLFARDLGVTPIGLPKVEVLHVPW